MMVRERMRADLIAAMKQREKTVVRTLRALLSAIDNAEAVELVEPANALPVEPVVGQSHDVPRKILTEEDVQQILQKEYGDRLAALGEYERLGRNEAASELCTEAGIIARYIGDSTSL